MSSCGKACHNADVWCETGVLDTTSSSPLLLPPTAPQDPLANGQAAQREWSSEERSQKRVGTPWKKVMEKVLCAPSNAHPAAPEERMLDQGEV